MTQQIKFLEETIARLVIDFDPDSLNTLFDSDTFDQDEIIDYRDIHYDDGRMSCVELSDGSVTLLENNKIEIIDSEFPDVIPMTVPELPVIETDPGIDVDF